MRKKKKKGRNKNKDSLNFIALLTLSKKKVFLVDFRHLFSLSHSLGCKKLSSFLNINTNNKKITELTF